MACSASFGSGNSRSSRNALSLSLLRLEEAQLNGPLDHGDVSLDSWGEVILGRGLRGDRPFAVVDREINAFRENGELLQIDLPSDPALIGPAAFDGQARVDRYVITGRGEKFGSKSSQLDRKSVV